MDRKFLSFGLRYTLEEVITDISNNETDSLGTFEHNVMLDVLNPSIKLKDFNVIEHLNIHKAMTNVLEHCGILLDKETLLEKNKSFYLNLEENESMNLYNWKKLEYANRLNGIPEYEALIADQIGVQLNKLNQHLTLFKPALELINDKTKKPEVSKIIFLVFKELNKYNKNVTKIIWNNQEIATGHKTETSNSITSSQIVAALRPKDDRPPQHQNSYQSRNYHEYYHNVQPQRRYNYNNTNYYSNQYRTRPQMNGKRMICENCNLPHDLNDICPAANQVCFKCNQNGHFSRCCNQVHTFKKQRTLAAVTN